jgi:hypothetical protein
MMKLFQLLLCAAFAITAAACGDSQQSAAPAAPSPGPTASAPTTPEPGSASGEPPAVTASSAAASAPECKDLEKADPKTCHPGDAVGNPNAK